MLILKQAYRPVPFKELKHGEYFIEDGVLGQKIMVRHLGGEYQHLWLPIRQDTDYQCAQTGCHLGLCTPVSIKIEELKEPTVTELIEIVDKRIDEDGWSREGDFIVYEDFKNHAGRWHKAQGLLVPHYAY
jgi:hypothetical protein